MSPGADVERRRLPEPVAAKPEGYLRGLLIVINALINQRLR